MKKLLILLFVFCPTLFPQVNLDEIEGIIVDSIFSIKIGEDIQASEMEINIDSLPDGACYNITIYDSAKAKLIQEIKDTLYYNFHFAALKFIDINLDNYLDIALVRDITMHSNSLYNFWLYNPKTKLFKYNSNYSELCCNMEIDKNKNEIFISYYDFINISSEERHYQLDYDKPILYELRETKKLEGIDSILVKEYRMSDNELRKIKEYKIKDEPGWE